MSLVDSSKKFRVVYSIYNHEYLGCLFSSHVVQELANGSLSLSHQALTPKNMAQFCHLMDDGDREIVCHLDKLANDEIVKRFGGTVKNIKDFFSKKLNEMVKSTVLGYVDRLMKEAIPMLREKPLYLSGKDGYPARMRVEIMDDLATVRFCLRRTSEDTRYYPLIYRNHTKLTVYRRDAALIVENPAWLLLGNEIFTFDEPMDGKKLLPFFSKPHIVVPKSAEKTFLDKFGRQLVRDYDVDATGIRISYVRRDPKFRFLVDGSGAGHVDMQLRVQYGNFDLKPEYGQKAYVELEEKGGEFVFYKIFRNPDAERDVLHYIERLQGGIGLLAMSMMGRQAGLQWLSENIKEISANGIEVVQDGKVQQFTFEQPQIVMEPVDSGDWFDIKAMVHISGFTIPFTKFRRHILQGNRDYALPNGSTAILPEEWFADYRHLLEIAEQRDDETLSIRKYQAVVLNMPLRSDKGLRMKLEGLLDFQSFKEFPVPQGVKAELRSYQHQGYNWLRFLQEYHFGGILADDMGLGKTLQTLSLLQHEKESGNGQPSLVVAPTSVIHNWLEEARKFTPSLRVLVHTGAQRTTDMAEFANQDLILTTYGLVRSDLERLVKLPFNYLILDESQMIKNPSSKTAKAVKELISKHRLSLTGTPVENTLMDLWSQMTFLNPGLLGTESFFRDFYVLPIEKYRDAARSEKLRKMMYPFILRRTKSQVALELPEKVEQVHYCEMTELQYELYEKEKNSYRNLLLKMQESEFIQSKLNVLAGLQKLRQIAIHPRLVEEGAEFELNESGKFQEYRQLLDEVISKGSKVLVFSQFVRLLKMLETDLQSRGIQYCYLDGSTVNRQSEVQRFQNDHEAQVFLISLKAGGVGLNLTAAEYVFILDPWWNPALERQATDRSHRIGQKEVVFSYKFISKNTIEEKILLLQERKSRLSEEVITVETELFKKLDRKDFMELLA